MVTKLGNRGRTITAGLVASVFSVLLSAFVSAAPAHAASVIQVDWVNTNTLHFSGSALSSPIDITGDFVGNVYGTPPGSQTFMAGSNGPVSMSFGCAVSMTLDIFPAANGALDFSHGNIIFSTDSPSTCSQSTLQANINGLAHDPNTGTANISLANISIGGVSNRGPAGGTDSPAQQIVNVTAGMNVASDYNGLPATDVFMLCGAQGVYGDNINQLYTDCLARNPSALSAQPLSSGNLQTINDNKGPQGGPEKAWTGQFTGVKAGVYAVCSTNLKSCQVFTKNPGQTADVYVSFGATAGSVIPGTPPGQGATEKVCTTGEGLAGNLGWILCPIVQLIASATNFFENNIIIPFLTVSPLTTNGDNPVYILWQNLRNVANVGFIIFFFIIIFSQATSIGISNYGIKRMLPRLVAVIIAVNLSYFIVAFIIDAFNIFGAGISQLVISALTQAHTSQLNGGSVADTKGIFTLGAAALMTVVVGGQAAIGWFFSFLLIALLVVVVVVIVLIIRQMAIIMLVILSPLAILMYLLPNTEGYYKKWQKTLIQLLIMYPMIVLLFASGKIFAVILQQPDLFSNNSNSGVSAEVMTAIRIILQFLMYVIPLAFLPATFAASGSIMGRTYGWLHGKAVQPRAGRLKEDAARIAGETQARLANNRVLQKTGIAQLAGRGINKNAVRQQRAANLQRAQQNYVAQSMGGTGIPSRLLRRQAAGVAGQAGATRAAATAANIATKGRNEDIDNEMSLLDAEMRRLGIDQKSFAAQAGKYFEDPTGTRDDGTQNSVIYGSNGTKFDISQNQHLQRALLNSAASQGEVAAVRAARINSSLDQNMVDDIVRRNDGKLKEKGGFDIATNFSLAYGRMTVAKRDGAGNMLKADGTITTNEAEAEKIAATDVDVMKKEMARQQFLTIAGSGANSVAGMKAGVLAEASRIIGAGTGHVPFTPNPSWSPEKTAREQKKYDDAVDVYNQLDPKTKQAIYDRLHSIADNSNTLARTEAPEAIKAAEQALRATGLTPSP